EAEDLRVELVHGFQNQVKKAGVDFDRLSDDRKAELLIIFERELTKRIRAAAEPLRAAASPTAAAFADILRLYKAGDAAGFDRAVAEYRANYPATISPADLRGVRFEAFFNRLNPFHHCLVLYVTVFA